MKRKKGVINVDSHLTVTVELEETGERSVMENAAVTIEDTRLGVLCRVSALEFLCGLGLEEGKKEKYGRVVERESPERLVFYEKGKPVCSVSNMRRLEKEVWAYLEEECKEPEAVRDILVFWYFELYFKLYERCYDKEWGCCKAFYEDRCIQTGFDFLEFSDRISTKECNEAMAAYGCDSRRLRRGGERIGYFTDEKERVRPVTSRVSYEWSCSFKAMFMYVLYRNIPWILKWAFMYECCSPEELIQGFGGRETTVTWLREMGVQADKTMSCEELAALMKSLPQFDTEAVSKFTAAQALFGNHYYMAEYSDQSYWTVRKRLEEQYSLPVLIQLTERCCQRVE